MESLNNQEELKTSEIVKNRLMLWEKLIFQASPTEIVEFYNEELPAIIHYFDEVKGEITNERYEINTKINAEPSYVELADVLAIHEVRHKVQHNLDIEMFDKETARELEVKYSVNIINSMPPHLSKNDFDADIVERIGKFLIAKGVSEEFIATQIISQNASDIIKNLERIK